MFEFLDQKSSTYKFSQINTDKWIYYNGHIFYKTSSIDAFGNVIGLYKNENTLELNLKQTYLSPSRKVRLINICSVTFE